MFIDDSSSSSSGNEESDETKRIILTFDTNVIGVDDEAADDDDDDYFTQRVLQPFVVHRWCGDEEFCRLEPPSSQKIAFYYDTPLAFSDSNINIGSGDKNDLYLHFVYLDKRKGKRQIYERLCRNLKGKEDFSVIIHNARDYDERDIRANYLLIDNNFPLRWISNIVALIIRETINKSHVPVKEDLLLSIGVGKKSNETFCGNNMLSRGVTQMSSFGPILISMKEFMQAYVNGITDENATRDLYTSLCGSGIGSGGEEFCSYLRPRYEKLKRQKSQQQQQQKKLSSCGCSKR